MPRDVSWKQELVLPVGQSTLTSDVANLNVLGVYAGVAAPDFEATTLDGAAFKLSSLRGKVVLLDFWASWCAPCVAELPNVSKAYDACAAGGFEVVGISFDRDADVARKFVADKKIPWRQIWAEKAAESPLAEQYSVTAIPATFLIGPDGKVIERDLRGEDLLRSIRRETAKLTKTPTDE